jgi:hypothetical protein
MKFFTIVAWVCGIAGGLIIIVGTLSLVTNITFFGLRHVVNYYHVANSILLLGILCLLAKQGCVQNKKNPD